jgi:hypothetical protein
MCDRFDQRGYLVRYVFGRDKRQVFMIPGKVSTRTWRFKTGVAIRAQSLADAQEWLDQYLEKRRPKLLQGEPH